MSNLPRVVILGAGFGGLWAARALKRSPVEVLLLDRNNYHTFFPLLYQVAAAELEPEEIAQPIRSILRGYPRVRFVMTEVTEIDLDARQVKTPEHVFSYDYLVMAAGSISHFFGVNGAQEHAFQLKTLEQGVALRNHILYCFERALCEQDPQARRRMLTFAIVGGGPTGVEFAGALAELIRGPLAKDFPGLDLREVSVLLLEAGDRLINGQPENLQEYAATRLRRMGVVVHLHASVEVITPLEAHLKDGRVIPSETMIWTAGVQGEPLKHGGRLPIVRGERVQGLPTLQIPGYPEVYIVGDLAHLEEGGHPLPMIAPVAIQEGEFAARNILRQIKGQEPLPFRYKDKGILATIGRNAAVAHLGKYTFTGFPAWLLWLAIHLYNLIGFRNRLFVLINWSRDYLFYERAVRLIIPAPASGLSKRSAQEIKP